MKKSLKFIGFVVIIIAIFVGYKNYTNKNAAVQIDKTKEPIKIGFVSVLTGDGSVWGEPMKNGFAFAVEQINNSGGINGRKIEAVYEDDGCEAKKGVSAFTKLIEFDHIKIITGSACSSVAMSVAPITQKNRVLYVASGATDPAVPKQGDLIFRLWISDAYEAVENAKYAINNLGLHKLAILYMSDNPAGLSVNEIFQTSVKNNSGEIVGAEPVSAKSEEVRTGLVKLLQAKPEGIYLMLRPEQMSVAINYLKDLKYDGKIFAYAPSIAATGVADKIYNKNNVYYAMPVIKHETEFWKSYKEKTGKEADVLVALGYDSMKMIEDGLKICGENNDCIRDHYLGLKDYITSRGQMSFDKDGDIYGVEFEFKKL